MQKKSGSDHLDLQVMAKRRGRPGRGSMALMFLMNTLVSGYGMGEVGVRAKKSQAGSQCRGREATK